MIIVSDTSPISGLLIIDKLDLLVQIYGKVIIPQAVFDELLALENYGYNLQKIHEAPWLELANPSDSQLVSKLNETLDQSEVLFSYPNKIE